MFQPDTADAARRDVEPRSPRATTTPAPDFVVIDVETACSRVSSICQIGIVGFRDGRVAFEFETLLDPRDHFSRFNTRIHGISAGHVAGQPCFAEVHRVVDGHLAGRTTVAHSYFDKGALAAACRVHRRPCIETTWLDSVRVAKRAWPELSSHRLNVLSGHLGIQHRHHDALSDARAAGLVVVKAIEHTGLSLSDWLMPSVRRRAGPAPRPAADGPLRGQRVAILREPRDGPLAQVVAAMGGRVVAAVGATTTMLVVAGDAPIGRGVTSEACFRRAEEMGRSSRPVRILTEPELIAITG